MFIVSWTIERSQDDTRDHFILCDTIDEARSEGARLSRSDDVYCWAISKVIDASEPHWMDGT